MVISLLKDKEPPLHIQACGGVRTGNELAHNKESIILYANNGA